MKEWADNNSVLTDVQFGFRSGLGIVDAAFVLRTIIERQINSGNKLFARFIDFRKAYDLIDRNSLWFKLIKSGIDGKLLRVLRSMYSNVKLCIKHMGNVSKFFDSNLGLLQGEVTSPIMFSLFLNDIQLHLQDNLQCGINIDQLSIYLLLFADDAVILSDTETGLQNSLERLKEYCLKWNLIINTDKTKIVIFRKGERLHDMYKWQINQQNIEVVSIFNYLGLVFSSGGSFSHATDALAGKALRAIYSLFYITKNFEVQVHVMFSLFDTFVGSILGYNCELWGFIRAENIERIHRKFCKWLLNVKMSTNSFALYAEVGRFSLIIGRQTRIG